MLKKSRFEVRVDWALGKATRWSVLGFLPMVIFGYPIFILPAYLFNIDTVFFSYAYRLCVLIISLLIIKANSLVQQASKGNLIILFVIFAYDIRLIYDLLVGSHPHVIKPLIFYNLVTIPIVLAAMACASKLWVEIGVVSRLLKQTAFLFATVLFVTYVTEYEYEFDVFLSFPILIIQAFNPISAAQLLWFSVCIVGCLMEPLQRQNSGVFFVEVTFLCSCAFFAITFNSAGPNIAFLCAIVFSLFSRVGGWDTKMRRSCLFLTLGLGGLMASSAIHDLGWFLDTINVMNYLKDDSAQERIKLITASLSEFKANPVFGSTFLVDPRGLGYDSHNLLSEIAVSLGLVGLLPCGVIFFLVCKQVKRLIATWDKHGGLMICALVFFVSCQMFSGVFWGSATLFVLIILILTRPNSNEILAKFGNL